MPIPRHRTDIKIILSGDDHIPASESAIYYSLTNVLAKGSFGEILSCVDAYGNNLAVKRVQVTSKNKMKLKKELDVLRMCKGHQHIIQLIDYYEINEEAYMVIEKAYGDLLQRLIKYEEYSESSVSKAIRCIASALEHLHDLGISHRDLKPDNILCFSSKNIFPIKLCDFDLCSYRVDKLPQRRDFKSQVGSIQYMAPEVASVWLGETDFYTKECDMWSLGMIAYVIFFRLTPFAFPCYDDCPLKCDGDCKDCEDATLRIVKTGNYVLLDDFKKVSTDAVHLIMNLLTVKPHLRLSANEVLSHKWIVNYCQNK